MIRGKETRSRVMRRVAVGAAATVLLACMVTSAAGAAPTGGFAVFAQCPTHAGNVDGCIYARIEGGYMAIGKTVVPITTTQVLQGGLLVPEAPGVKKLIGALNGETFSKAGQVIPGGLLGRTLIAVPELAAPASSVVLNPAAEQLGSGTALTLPLKIKLDNPLLGAECEIGSRTDPIVLNLTTGATGDGLGGNPGSIKGTEGGLILRLSGASLVSSAFTAPQAGGCGSSFVDALVDARMGLPTSRNEVAFNARMEIADSEAVEEAEG